MDTNAAVKLAERFGRSASAELPVTGVWLYGSWVYGIPTEYSDIDIGVTMKIFPTDILAVEKLLFKIRRKIDTRIEPVLINPEGDRSGFSEMVIKKGIRVYPKVHV